MKRVFPYVLAGVLGALAGYFLAPHCDADLALTECKAHLEAETRATVSLARELDVSEAAAKAECEDRIDKSLADRARH